MTTFEQTFEELPLAGVHDLAAARHAEGWRYVQILAVNTEEGIDLVYSYMKDGHLANFNVSGVKQTDVVPSITDLYLEAFVCENEIHDLFDVAISDIAIDFGGNFYALAQKEPMTIISPEQKAAREKAKKVAAAKAAKEKAAKAAAANAAYVETHPDAAPAPGERLAFSTDTFVVTPHFFPGGNIGRLAVCGTVNDVATSGAKVKYLSVAMVLEEGFPMDDLRRICASMAEAAREAGVRFVTGDTKVVNRGHGDGIYINTSGVGALAEGVNLGGAQIRPGDAVLVSGTLGDHGITIMSCREGLNFSANIESDAAPLNHLIADVLAAAPHTRCFRDPTRGGIASTLNELAEQSANGTYEDGTDRVQLQKEVTQLKNEINRIADSANFNGINLLDGSMAGGASISGKIGTTNVSFSIGSKSQQVDGANDAKVTLSGDGNTDSGKIDARGDQESGLAQNCSRKRGDLSRNFRTDDRSGSGFGRLSQVA